MELDRHSSESETSSDEENTSTDQDELFSQPKSIPDDYFSPWSRVDTDVIMENEFNITVNRFLNSIYGLNAKRSKTLREEFYKTYSPRFPDCAMVFGWDKSYSYFVSIRRKDLFPGLCPIPTVREARETKVLEHEMEDHHDDGSECDEGCPRPLTQEEYDCELEDYRRARALREESVQASSKALGKRPISETSPATPPGPRPRPRTRSRDWATPNRGLMLPPPSAKALGKRPAGFPSVNDPADLSMTKEASERLNAELVQLGTRIDPQKREIRVTDWIKEIRQNTSGEDSSRIPSRDAEESDCEESHFRKVVTKQKPCFSKILPSPEEPPYATKSRKLRGKILRIEPAKHRKHHPRVEKWQLDPDAY